MHLLGKTRTGGSIARNEDGRIERLQGRHGIAWRLGGLDVGDVLLCQLQVTVAGGHE